MADQPKTTSQEEILEPLINAIRDWVKSEVARGRTLREHNQLSYSYGSVTLQLFTAEPNAVELPK